MEQSQQQRQHCDRLGDQLGAWYTPLAVAIALLAWWWSGDAIRFMAVLVVATPCPLLIAIPVAIIGSISLAARTFDYRARSGSTRTDRQLPYDDV